MRHKLVTYPRTDSNYLTDDMVDTIQERLRAILATDYKSHVRDLISESFSSKMHILIIKKFQIIMRLFPQRLDHLLNN